MAKQDDVRTIAMALPGVVEDGERFGFSVENRGKAKGFVWVWMERVDPKKPRIANPAVLAARVADQADKAALLAADPDTFFTEPHYNGFPAVLVRLAAVSQADLRQIVVDAWRCQAPRAAVAAYDAGSPAPPATKSTRPRRGARASRRTASARPAQATPLRKRRSVAR